MASPNISFDSIPSSIRRPGKYFEFNTRLAVRSLPSNAQRILIHAQRLAAGTSPAGSVVLAVSDEDAAQQFGRGSIAHLMVLAALTANRYVELRVLPYDDAAGATAAVYSVPVAGTVSSSGQVTVKVTDLDPVQVAVTVGQDASAVAAAVATALTAQLINAPLAFSSNAGTIVATAKNKGTVLNGLSIQVATTAAGITLTSSQTTSGAGDPSLTVPLANVFSASYELLVTPFNTQAPLAALRDHIDSRSGPREQRGGYVVYATTGVLAAATTLAGQLNGGRVTGALCQGTVTPSYEVAAAYGAVIASEEDPAQPLNGLVLTGVAVPPIPSQLGGTEIEVCLANGVTPLTVRPGNVVGIERAITTYLVNQNGTPDVSLLDLTTIRTLDYVRIAIRTRVDLRFPRSKMYEGIELDVRSEIINVLYELQDLGIVENVDELKDDVIVERDLQDNNRMDARIPVDVVNGLHVFAGRLDLIL